VVDLAVAAEGRKWATKRRREMRLLINEPDQLTDEQRSRAADMKGIAKSFHGFVNIHDDGA
jgi:hypothetical protein